MKKNRKLWLGVGIVVMIGIVLVGIYRNSQQVEDDNVIRIGAVLTLSGDVSYWANELKKGMDIATEFINSDTNNLFRLCVKYEDNAFNPQRAISAYKKLMLTEEIDVFISCFTPMCQAITSLGKESKKPILLTITSATDIAAKNEYVYRDYITQSQQCPPLAEYAFNEMGMRRGSYLVLSDDYGRDGVHEFSRRFNELGGKMLIGEYFARSDLSIRGHVQKVLSVNPEFVFVIAGDQSLLNACHQIREIDKKVKIIGLTAFDSEDVWKSLQENGEGVVFSSGNFDQIINDKFALEFERRNKNIPNATNIYGFSIVQYLYALGVESKIKGVGMEKLLSKMDNVNSIRGVLRMNENHDVVSPIGIYQRKGGRCILKKVVR